jgi:hypothetical protein
MEPGVTQAEFASGLNSYSCLKKKKPRDLKHQMMKQHPTMYSWLVQGHFNGSV